MRVWGVRVLGVRYVRIPASMHSSPITLQHAGHWLWCTPPPGWGPWLLPSSVYCIRTTDSADTGHQGHQNLTSSDPHYPLSTTHYPLSTIHYPLSTIHLSYTPLSSALSLPLFQSGKGIESRVTESYQHKSESESSQYKYHLTGSDAKSKSKFQHPASPGRSIKYNIVFPPIKECEWTWRQPSWPTSACREFPTWEIRMIMQLFLALFCAFTRFYRSITGFPAICSLSLFPT